MAPQHRAEALRALTAIQARLAQQGGLDGLEVVQVRGLVEYARVEVEQIQEVKKVRRRPPAVETTA